MEMSKADSLMLGMNLTSTPLFIRAVIDINFVVWNSGAYQTSSSSSGPWAAYRVTVPYP